ncbi:MAG: replication protein P [Candidatus Endonucleobacter bathymodioli]|uniref:Replication protein P n=1 Tax=Candidatus Endonucleibacter bathymodioli TaxID=539814 RepID=A0AA90NKV6_9GAMM|nr:replication protein P [Candidatus Endonucleobacter bathymodioli]
MTTGSRSLRTDCQTDNQDGSLTPDKKQALGQAINGLFRLLEDAYPHRFRSAFPKDEDFIRAKRVWARILQGYSPRRIMLAAEKALATSKYMPDLATIRDFCKLNYNELGLKEPLQAYYEACQAPDHTLKYPWSHIAIYFAAKETGWLTLRSEEQRVVYPIFERNYSIICNRVVDGEDLETTILQGIEDSRTKELARQAEEVADQVQRTLMVKQGIDPTCGTDAHERLKKVLYTK